jgi:hypothetical protein
VKTNIQAEQDDDKEKKFTMTPHFVRALTIQQLDKLKQRDPDFFIEDENFIGAYFQKEHAHVLSEENATNMEELTNLRRIYDLAKKANLPDNA